MHAINSYYLADENDVWFDEIEVGFMQRILF